MLEEVAGREVERRGEPVDVVERDVALSALDSADIRSVESRRVSERLLAESALSPERPDALAELQTVSRDLGGHSSKVRVGCL